MSLLLCIDTSNEYGGVCLAQNDKILAIQESGQQKDQAAFIHVALSQLEKDAQVPIKNVDAVTVVNGPGSYTGLRVGLATAKGLCLALNKPLITLSTLETMALSAIRQTPSSFRKPMLYCPMIDARRNEVFTAVYNEQLDCLQTPAAMILQENSFSSLLEQHSILFFGSGSAKAQNFLNHAKALFAETPYSIVFAVKLGQQAFYKKEFADVAYCEPFYLKEFFMPAKKNKEN